MSKEMKDKLTTMARIGAIQPELIAMVGTIQNAEKWTVLSKYNLDAAVESRETAYDESILDNVGELITIVFALLIEMGVSIPKEFPKELDFDYQDFSDETEHLFDALDENPHSKLIRKLFDNYVSVNGYWITYVHNVLRNNDNENECLIEMSTELYYGLIELAATKLSLDDFGELENNFLPFSEKHQREWEKSLNKAKDMAYRFNIPLKSELMDMVTESTDTLDIECEAMALGFRHQWHPDFYMNEILTHLRTQNPVEHDKNINQTEEQELAQIQKIRDTLNS